MFKLCITGDLGFEVWKDIPGYEGLYQASTYGRVKSENRTVNSGIQNNATVVKRGRILKSCSTSKYEQMILSNGKTHTNKLVHKLIAITFLPKPQEGQTQINHKDENKLNNRVENLEWCTPKYNNTYGTRLHRVGIARSKPILQFDLEGNLIKTYISAKKACELNGFQRSAICDCCKGKRKQAYGFVWKYA